MLRLRHLRITLAIAAAVAAVPCLALPASAQPASTPPPAAAPAPATPAAQPTAPAKPEVTVTLKDGTVVKGALAAETPTEVTVETAKFGTQKIQKTEIASLAKAGQEPPPSPIKQAEAAVDHIKGLLAEYGLKVLGAMVILLIAWIAAGWIRRIIREGLGRAKFEPTIVKFASNVAKYLVIIIGVLSSLPLFGVNITALAALLGAGGLAIGLASQGALSNLAAGLMLLITRPFKVGDVIVVDGFSGIVEEIELFATKLNTPDNRRIIMPNNSIFGKVIENMTFNPNRSSTFSVVVAGDSDVDQVRSVLRQACDACPLVLKTPAPGTVVSNLEAGGIKWDITVWAETGKLGLARDQAIVGVRAALAAAGIKPPAAITQVRLMEPIPTGGNGVAHAAAAR